LSFLLFRFSEPNNVNQNLGSVLTQPSDTDRIFYGRSMLAQVVSQMTGVKCTLLSIIWLLEKCQINSKSRSGMNVKWVCETNLEQKFLGVSQAAFCIYNEDILSD